MKFTIIAAISKNGVIGKDGKLPWKLRDDLQFFKEKTVGHSVIMGRKCYDSLGRPSLPMRENIVLTRNKDLKLKECKVVCTLEDAYNSCSNKSLEVFVIGGADIYREALPFTNKMYLTMVDAEVAGDVFFPEFNIDEWDAKHSFVVNDPRMNTYPFCIDELVRK